MDTMNRDMAIKKITEMPKEQVSKVLIFMAGMEAEHVIGEQDENRQPHKASKKDYFVP